MDVIYHYKTGRALFFTIALLVLSLFCINDASAISSSAVSAAPALDGTYKKGMGLPLKITIENTRGVPLEGVLEITGGLMEYKIAINSGLYSTYEKWIIVYPTPGNTLLMKFKGKDGFSFYKEIQTTQFISTKKLILHISKEKGKTAYSNSSFNNEYAFIEVRPGELWDIWKGYDGADHVLLDADAVELMTSDQLRALKRYVTSGGSLYIGGSRYPEIYRQDFFRDIRNIKGAGHISLLSSDASNPSSEGQDSLLKFPGEQKRAIHIPSASSSEETGKLFANIVKWNTGYLLLLALAGFSRSKRYRRFLWPLLSILVVVTSLASMGMMNGKNRMRSISVINMNNDDEDAFLQSRLTMISARNTGMTAEFKEGFIYPAETVNSSDTVRISENGLTENVTADLPMLGRKDIIWERFEKLPPPLHADLAISAEGIKGEIENLSGYPLKEAAILINERYFPLPPIESGHKISINMLYEKDEPMPYPQGIQWISNYILNNEEGMTVNSIKIVGLWERPLLRSIDSGLLLEKEETFLIYHM